MVAVNHQKSMLWRHLPAQHYTPKSIQAEPQDNIPTTLGPGRTVNPTTKTDAMVSQTICYLTQIKYSVFIPARLFGCHVT